MEHTRRNHTLADSKHIGDGSWAFPKFYTIVQTCNEPFHKRFLTSLITYNRFAEMTCGHRNDDLTGELAISRSKIDSR